MGGDYVLGIASSMGVSLVEATQSEKLPFEMSCLPPQTGNLHLVAITPG